MDLVKKKFRVGNYLKNQGDCCDFLQVLECDEETEYGIHIKAKFYTQLHSGMKEVSNEIWIKIMKREYKNWKVYKPRGVERYEI